MKIYISHSSNFDFKKELYELLKSSEFLSRHDLILPHEKTVLSTNSKEIINHCDLLIAEVSYPSIGLGIELGWAENAKVKIICLHKSDTRISSSLPLLFPNIFTYTNSVEMLEKIIIFMKKELTF